MTSDPLSLFLSVISLLIAIGFGIANLWFTRRTFDVTSVPIPQVIPTTERMSYLYSQSPRQSIYCSDMIIDVINLHSSTSIDGIQVKAYFQLMQHSRWWKQKKWIEVGKVTIPHVLPNDTQTKKIVLQLENIVNMHFPGAFEIADHSDSQLMFRATRDMDFLFRFRMTYRPAMHGTRPRHVSELFVVRVLAETSMAGRSRPHWEFERQLSS